MILTSFFRRKNTQIYLLLFTILFFLINSTNLLIENIEKIIDNNFSSSTLLYIKSEKNYENLLRNNKYITNIKRTLIFDYGNIENINENDLIEEEIGGVLVYSANSNELLNESELIIGLKELNFANNKHNISKLISKYSLFYYEGIPINLKIMEIINSKKRNELVISANLFNELITKSKYYIYTANITKNSQAVKIINELNNQVEGNVILLENLNEKEQKTEKILNNNLKYLQVTNVLIYFVALVLFLIISNNTKNDLNNEINLEKILGFSSYKITYYLFKRIFLLHTISLLLSIFLIKILNLFLNYSLISFLFRIIKLLIFILIYDITICLLFKMKLKGGD